VVVQLIITVLIVGAVMPAILFATPAVRGGRTGTALVAVLLLGIFLVVRMAWPRPRNG
jgi:hypothetical protein